MYFCSDSAIKILPLPFPNALVRANYNDYENNSYATTEYLMHFLGNLLFDENNDLKNRYLHISFKSTDIQSTNKLEVNDPVKLQNDLVNKENVGEMSEKCRTGKIRF